MLDFHRSIRFSLLAGAALVVAQPAFAQTAAQTDSEAAQQPAAPAATGADNAEGSDNPAEATVTARRTSELLRKVPGSVSAFNERALDRIQATDPTGLQGAVPNLNIVQGRGSSNATNVYIRGIGQPDALQTFDPAVGVYVDDVYLSRIRGTQLDLLDLERVEVLRGPQGTLYGKNTIGGALKFITRRPGDVLRANASLSVGSYDAIDFKGAVSGPINSNLSAGLAVMRSVRDGYVQDRADGREYNDKNSVGARASLAWDPADNVRVDLSGDYSKDDAALTVGRPINNLTNVWYGAFGGLYNITFPVTDPVGSGSYDWKGRTTPGLPNSTKLKHRGVSMTVAADIDPNLTLKSISAYRKLNTDDYIDIDATEYEIGDVFVGVDQKQVSQEFQLLYTSDRLKAVLGGFWMKEDVGSHQEAYSDDFVRPLYTSFLRTIDDDLETNSVAAFANVSYEIVPKLRLSGGLRWTRETKDYDRTTSRYFNGAFFDKYDFLPPRGKWTDLSPMASVDYELTPDWMIYGRVAKGFKSGGFNGRSNTGPESSAYDPETALSWEAGVKGRIGRTAGVSLAAFTTDYKDFQARVSGVADDPVLGVPSPKLAVLNAGKLKISGVELEGNWTPLDKLMLDTQVGYLNADYKEFDDATFTSTGGDRSFQTPAFSPKWTARFGAQYGFALGGNGEVTLGGQLRYKSRHALAIDNTFNNSTTKIEGLFQDGYWLSDARIVWEPEGKRFSVGVYGNNLGDKAYKTDGQEFSTVGGIRTVYYGAPRTISLKVTARY